MDSVLQQQWQMYRFIMDSNKVVNIYDNQHLSQQLFGTAWTLDINQAAVSVSYQTLTKRTDAELHHRTVV